MSDAMSEMYKDQRESDRKHDIWIGKKKQAHLLSKKYDGLCDKRDSLYEKKRSIENKIDKLSDDIIVIKDRIMDFDIIEDRNNKIDKLSDI